MQQEMLFCLLSNLLRIMRYQRVLFLWPLLLLFDQGAFSFVVAPSHRQSSQGVGAPSILSPLLAVETSSSSSTVWTKDALEKFADQEGIVLSLSTLGPGYRAVARAKHNTTQILGYVEGFVRPGKTLLHLDKMEVFRPNVKRARSENPEVFRDGGTILGVGLLLGYLCLLHGRDEGCQTAEFLAIDDEDYQHKRLVRYYKSAGFDEIKYVGEGLGDVPDRLVWGGCGTLLRKDISFLLQKWSGLMQTSKDKREQQ